MLSTHVVFQTTRLTIPLLANVAFVRFLVRVSTLVVLQSTRLCKTLLAHITLVRFLVRVNTHVALQMTRLCKTLLTHITFVRFLVRVNTHVLANLDALTNTFSHTSHSCPLFLFTPLRLSALIAPRHRHGTTFLHSLTSSLSLSHLETPSRKNRTRALSFSSLL